MNTRQTMPAMLAMLLLSACVQGDDDDRDGWRGWKGGPDVAAVNNALYREECGACHFAYQPGLLPVRSWQRLMAGLEDHFGDDAELDPAEAAAIAAYLDAGAADRVDYRRSRAFAGSIAPGDAPLRVTATRYFAHKHDEVPARLVTGNPKVGSFSACQACHTSADSGNYNEHEVHIAGFGRWDD